MFNILKVDKKIKEYIEFNKVFSKNNKVLELKENFIGKDYVVGDIHGQYKELFKKLKSINFEPSRDRLICVGDLVDRGLYSLDSYNWLNYSWFYSVMGNHEFARATMYFFEDKFPEKFKFMYEDVAIDWYEEISRAERQRYILKFLELPLLIEIHSNDKKIGILHGDFPESVGSWEDLKKCVNNIDYGITQKLLFGRTNAKSANPIKDYQAFYSNKNVNFNVKGVDRLCVGHTVQVEPSVVGNYVFLDTGAGYMSPNKVSPDRQYSKGFFSIYDIKEDKII